MYKSKCDKRTAFSFQPISPIDREKIRAYTLRFVQIFGLNDIRNLGVDSVNTKQNLCPTLFIFCTPRYTHVFFSHVLPNIPV